MKFPIDFYPPDGVKVHPQKSVINWFANDIYHIHALSEIEHTLEDAKLQCMLMEELFGETKVKVLIDLRTGATLTYAARKHYGTEEGKKNNGYTAVLVNSAFTRVVANFLVGSFKSSLQTKLFREVDDAVKWLNSNK
jgi:hypothetical protein